MRTSVYLTILLSTLSVTLQAADKTASLRDQADRINYSIGHQIGTDFMRQNIMLNPTSIRRGLEDGQNNSVPLLDQQQMSLALLELKKNITRDMQKKAEQKIQNRKILEQEKRQAGIEFLQQNQQKEGVKTMPSGLQYKVLKSGNGKHPNESDYVTFNYMARTLDGKAYDSSFKKGKPATYRANGVLPGFTEAIQMMQPGARWELYLPPELAYGRQGPLAHQTIIIETELLSINQ
ncbi:MAG: FKBP-type peptidyl-prolyl cis-trans isomerase [Gammaproteobacteria bacterium]|nr:FKBP-type peptidyl-prolyl cis-trans isomerase [Gammaproteobacteria bacterium]MBL6999762.1 FKBP-type peptidyl-prolyl cis-trans isomerase [Gammaproteobacteria bacterium]